MKRIAIDQTKDVVGGKPCDYAAGLFGGLGAGLVYSLIPINVVVGSIALGTSALLGYACK